MKLVTKMRILTQAKKKLKLDKWEWFWANDSYSGHQNEWVKYEPDVIEKLEVAHDKKTKNRKN